MKRVKVKIVGKGTDDDPFNVDLPTWCMIGEVDHNKKECEVYVPDDEVLPTGKLNQAKIREKYKENWSNFNASNVEV